jgi:hypothetical protein
MLPHPRCPEAGDVLIRPFKSVLDKVGAKPSGVVNQNQTRYYSETLSKEIAHWLRDMLLEQSIGAAVLTPEAKVKTIYGGKSLDVGVVDDRGYLLLDVSVKTFNFKDRQTGNYRHNFTGRFYELLGEELDIRRSYRWATLVAIVFLPADSVEDSSPSSFANAVRQYSKIVSQDVDMPAGFEHVFIAVHGTDGSIYFFDASGQPPREGHPRASARMSIESLLATVRRSLDMRRERVARSALPVHMPFQYSEPHQD